jgi:hypothetical protein
MQSQKSLRHVKYTAYRIISIVMADVLIIKGQMGFIKVRDYFMIAENICKSVIKIRNQRPFLCLNLTYITAFLRNG